MEISKCWKIVEFPKISIKMKNCKTFYEAQTVSHVKEIIHPLHHSSPEPNEILLHLCNKNFLRRYTEIYRHLLSKCFKNAILERRNDAVQMFFSDTKQKNIGWTICKVRMVFGCVAKAYYFQCQVSWASRNEWGFWSKTVL